MKILKTFETWNDNIIDKSLFTSGKAKYNPKVVGGVIKYKTGNAEPYYFAEITKKGNKFICKIYKRKKNGEEIRLKNKLKKELKLAHNYVREYLNQKLKNKKKSKKSNDEDVERIIKEDPQVQREMPEFTPEPMTVPPPRKTIIRRF
jgi:hypothetical protein